ncbi:EAL domain-containing protein [Rhizobium sp. TH2]|uniref:putative bifunctional diguanylate cyclase/phosphodiesterase n=1 Tax=Rhizobium sp. TH2 TaxID=2775403 RepID=UPI00215757CD|nr:EAL domain-containing protein [Rhizobium sp. TH2]UVC11502.1 EAL domain-containing protein [Rhizobium sp. TH2]
MDAQSARPEDHDHYARLRAAQAESVLGNIALTLASNIFVAVTTTGIIWSSTEDASILSWLALVISLSAARFMVLERIMRLGLHQTRPDAVLKFLTVAALVSGISWMPLPLLFAASDGDYIVFVMAGTATGAIIQSLSYWRSAIAFGAPVMGATLVSMLMESSTVSNYLLALNVALLTLMLFRASVLSERAFVRSQNVAMRTTQLAQSLAVANTEINKSSHRLEHLANTDVLTGLANRAVFNRRMEALFYEGGRERREIALLLIDLDKFKTINDTRGHHAGDTVLKAAATRLAALCASGDLPIRLGGDEFAVILSGRNAAARADDLARRFIDAAAEPVSFGGTEIPIGASIGIACAPDHAADEDELYACADLALYCAKIEGRRRLKLFDGGLKGQLDYQRAIDRDLGAALAQGGLDVHFQPQVDMACGRVTGFEALVRWWHPDIGAISPPDIVSAATKLQLSERLTAYVAECACRFIRTLDRAGHADAVVSINMSPSEFDLYSPALMLGELARRHGINPNRIEVEITEEAILDPQKVETAFFELRRAGFRLAVDDFGMGHSSLAHLISLKIDRLKVDRHFVTGISASAHNQALVAALVSVSRSLDMELVVEGVETAADAETLRMLGCRIGQGWLYGKAMPEAEVLTWLNRHHSRVKAVA